MSLKLPADFAKKISESLGMTPLGVETLFTVEEDKQGFFVAKLKPGQFLEREQFKTMCALARDLGGEGYLQGAKAWAVPGPFAKKSPESPSGQATDCQPAYKQPGNALPADRKKEPVGVMTPSVVMDKSKHQYFSVPVDKLVSLPIQIRTEPHKKVEELAESVKTFGLMHPICVRPHGPFYQIVTGGRRVAAVKKLGWTEISADVRDLTDEEAYQIQGAENIDREDLSDLEKARWLGSMMQRFGYTQEILAKKLGKDQTWVSRHLAILQLNNIMPRGIMESGEITERQAREILSAPAEKQQEIVDKINETGEIPAARELHEMAHPKPKTVPCERCGDPIEGPAIHSKGKFFCTDCATILKTEQPEPEGVPEPEPVEGEAEPVATVPESPKPKRKPEALLTGYPWTCPECGDKYIINHVDWPGSDHREHRLEACKK